MGWELCIRDSDSAHRHADGVDGTDPAHLPGGQAPVELERRQDEGCLLYTSDAADERSSVDLGGRRIIKKQKSEREG